MRLLFLIIIVTDFTGLPEPELVDLMNIVGVKVAFLWNAIGLRLGFKDWELKGIQAAKSHEIDSPKACMMEVFSQWKSGLKSEYSWKHLAEVLVTDAVNMKGLLNDMYKELKK